MQDTERARLRWNCRRGMMELDLLLAGWLDRRWTDAAPALRGAFGALLEEPDADLADWLVAGRRPPPPHREIVADILRLRR